MKKFITILSLVLFAVAGSQAAVAANFDFVSYADVDGDSDGHLEWGYSAFSVTESGIGLTATGKYSDGMGGWNDAFAYLDQGNAGLGVCKNITVGNQCVIGSDDNVTPGEKLILAFDQVVSLDEVIFRDGGHGQSFSGDFQLSIDGGALMSYALTASFIEPLVGQKFEFFNNNSNTSNAYQFYIDTANVSAVPIPAALFLFTPALLGFFGMRKKLEVA